PSPKPAPPAAPLPRRTATYASEDFTSISTRELREAAKAKEVATSPWWGRTDTIPPGDDVRTKLIDRALVTRGYLSPEQLVEIHRVGDLMLLKKGDEAMLRVQAQRAVAQSKKDRAARKAERKRQAQERQRARAEAVARRKAVEIDFLGRGVSGGLALKVSDDERLKRFGLPSLSTPAQLAASLSIPLLRLRWLAFHSEASTVSHYVRFQIPKKSGGTREIWAPQPRLAAAQAWILGNILSKVPVGAVAHGFVPGRSTVTNATPHVRRAIVVNVDLQDFFPTITFPRVKGIFESLGYSPAVATVLALLSTECPRREVEYSGRRYHVATGPRALPQGACTSPALSNLASWGLDRRLGGVAAKLGWTYTRYADDLTFSGDTLVPKGEKNPRSVGWLLARVRHVCEAEGFLVNQKKVRVQRRNTAQSVTGVVVNDKPSTPRAERRRLRAILHHARFEGLDRQNRDGKSNYLAWLRGHVAYVMMVNPEQGRKLKMRLDALLASGK
ncbi:MAG TPA: reverse transcriptase family protein, partial [Planctomycetota bacterium]|nr:reverse transcriptase family protein [Planctomycetota bacterium]